MKVTLCRLGYHVKYGYPNRKIKGTFTREFDSIESLVKFMVDTKNTFFLPYFSRELTNKQARVYLKKYYSLVTKNFPESFERRY